MNLLAYIRAKPRQHASRQHLGSLLLLLWWIWHPEPQRTEKTCQTEDSLIPWLSGILCVGKNSSSLISLVLFCVCPCTGTMSAEAPIPLNLDIRDLQIQTVTVEKLLEPLIIQVGALRVLQCATACVLAEFKMVGIALSQGWLWL